MRTPRLNYPQAFQKMHATNLPTAVLLISIIFLTVIVTSPAADIMIESSLDSVAEGDSNLRAALNSYEKSEQQIREKLSKELDALNKARLASLKQAFDRASSKRDTERVTKLAALINSMEKQSSSGDLLGTAGVVPDAYEAIEALRDKLAGTTWIHNYKEGRFPFTFGRNGTIEKHGSWDDQPWRVVSSSEVVIGEKASRGKMIFTFDDDVKSFVTLDWDGTPTSGERE
jgi:hypothetical protein